MSGTMSDRDKLFALVILRITTGPLWTSLSEMIFAEYGDIQCSLDEQRAILKEIKTGLGLTESA